MCGAPISLSSDSWAGELPSPARSRIRARRQISDDPEWPSRRAGGIRSTYEMRIAVVARMHGDRYVAEHRFRARRCDLNDERTVLKG